MKALRRFPWLALWLCLAPGWAGAYQPGQPVALFTAQIQPATLHPGEHPRLVVTAVMEPLWHVYSVFDQGEDAPPPTQLALSAPGLTADGPAYETNPIRQFDAAIGLQLAYHEHQAKFYQNLTLTRVEPHQGKLNLVITYQACNDKICLPPTEAALSLDYQVNPGLVREEFATPNRGVDPPSRLGLAGTGAKGLAAFVTLAALMGLASLLTPCVFPMVPITVSYFAREAHGDSARLVKLALLFGSGIVATYTGTGLIVSSLFGAAQVSQLATNPWPNLLIALIFIVFSLSLMGLFELQLPQTWQNYFDARARRLGGALGVLLMGFTFTLTAFTCTVQFVGTLLIAAAGGEWLWPLVGMLVFSSVFAAPFVLLALSPGWITKMQGSGGAWLGRSKVVLGLLELALSLKFLSNADMVWQTNLLSRNANLVAWMVIFFLAALYLATTNLQAKSMRQWGWVLVFVGLTYGAAQGMGNRSLGGLVDSLLPPPSGLAKLDGDFATAAEVSSLQWHHELASALTQAQAENKPIFLEFTGYTCVNCRWMEQNVLAQTAVYQELKTGFVLLRLYTDGGGAAKANMQFQIERFQTVALPLYAVLSPQGDILNSYVGMSPSLAEFQRFLRQGLR